ncbi:MAG: hypothetical protein MJZ19_09145 [Paludibacteraceae bacterium]|nr:hypothetical protein [Paludibacteraceae bacterium]
MSGKIQLTNEILDEYKNIQKILRDGGEITNGQRATLEIVKECNTPHNFYDTKSGKLVWDSRLSAKHIECSFKNAFKSHIENSGNIFKVTQEAKENCERISEWLYYQQKPFLILQGSFGNGKTSSAKSIMNVIRKSNFKSKSWEGDLNDKDLSVAEYDAATLFEDLAFGRVDKERIYTIPFLSIDDLGVEPASYNHFGTVLTPIHDLLRARYERRLITVITTNLTAKLIRESYGERIFDRLKEASERILFIQDSFRGCEDNSFMKMAK